METTAEQTQRLIDLGIGDKSTTSFTLEQLLNIVPKDIEIEQCFQYAHFSDEWEIEENFDQFYVDGCFVLTHENGLWNADYEYGFLGKIPSGKTQIDAIVRLLELLHVNGYDFGNR